MSATSNYTDPCSESSGIMGENRMPYAIVIGISPIFIFALTWLVKGKNGQRPGWPTPIPIIDPCRQRLFYAAFWGMLAYETFQFFSDSDQLVISTRCFNAWQRPLILLLNVPLYAFLYYPIVAGYSTDNFLGFLISTLWTWIVAILRIWDVYNFVKDEPDYTDIAADIFQEILPLLFIWFLSVYIPIQTGLAFWAIIRQKRKLLEPVHKPAHYKLLPEGLYVRELLKHREPVKKVQKTFIQKVIRLVTYKNVPYFRYSQTVLSTVVVSVVFVYYILYSYFRFVIIFVPGLRILAYNVTEDIAALLNVTTTDKTVEMVEAYFDSLSASLIATGVIVILVQLVMVITVLPNYRRDLLNAYRGSYKHIISPKAYDPRTYLTYALKYMGEQAVMFAWGCTLQIALFSVLSLAIAWIVVVPLMYGFGAWVIQAILNVLPALAVTGTLAAIQYGTVAFFLTEDDGKTLAVKNHRGYSNFAYVAFFKNLLIGLIGALVRVILSAVFGVIMFPRLDLPVLNRRLERLDEAFVDYVGLIHVENHHMNPCLITFVNIVLEEAQKTRQLRRVATSVGQADLGIYSTSSDGTAVAVGVYGSFDAESLNPIVEVVTEQAKNKPADSKFVVVNSSSSRISDSVASCRSLQVRFRWHMVYTLIRNPILIVERKIALGKTLI